ncbi:endoribonuclease MazF [Klebsiella pneumoniae]|uniref:endoribonuclease MazF n=1 Tax=Klebsiella pneumoniae TaxID=573 RepID=UPI00107AEB4C|nr:endoribonuclease MazF [Salmonella enterica]EKV8190383.1 endoribonuclease MazF [Klebsiella pneumoniae]HAU6861800.1 endoribonuclease MazF [Salmonella enterica subsp. enterica serovar Senftenberg]
MSNKKNTSQYIPDCGDVVWLDFDPQAGHEQAGHRPALVLSPEIYNGKTGLMLCCPMSTKVKGYPFEVRNGEASVILSDQVKSLDWRKRGAVKKGSVTAAVLAEVRAKLKVLIG